MGREIMSIEFSQKEKDIFHGVIALARQGENIFTLKVQQIADAAQIGKSTLYEYFSSREEILAKALIYSLAIEMKEFKATIENNTEFIGMVTSAIDYAHNSVMKNSSSFSLLNSAMQDSSMRDTLCSVMPNKDVMMQGLLDVLNNIIEKGRREGVVDSVEDNDFCNMAMMSTLCTVIFTTTHKTTMPWEVTRANAIKMLCKTLA